MRSVIGEILPLSVGIAIGPLAIIAAVLMLLSPQARSTSLGFLAGWVIGITVAVVSFTLLALMLPEQDSGSSSSVVGVVKVILGGLLLLLAVLQWRGRPAEGETAELPKWMSAIDSMTATKALGLGFLLAAVNPKNLLLAASAGVIIGSAALSFRQAVAVVTIYVVLAACTVLIPVSAYLLASARMSSPLDEFGTWLVDNSNAIMTVLFLVLGVAMIGKRNLDVLTRSERIVMAHLSVWKFNQPDGASQALRTLKELQDEGLIVISDAAIVEWPEGKKKPATRQLHDLVGPAALHGAFWVLFFGIIFFFPFLSIGIGAGGGALVGSLRDVGIDDDFIDKVKASVVPGTSAIFVLSSSGVVDRIRQRFIGTHAELIYSDLGPAEEARLREIFEQD